MAELGSVCGVPYSHLFCFFGVAFLNSFFNAHLDSPLFSRTYGGEELLQIPVL
jgi:hypothetical protein